MTDAVIINSGVPTPVFMGGATGAGSIVPGPAGDVARAADRTALGAIAATAGMTRYLTETGREGIFVFSAANLSALVTADTAQGIYVPPAAAPTGASGAWVRQPNFDPNIKQVGAVGDNATADSAALAAGLALSRSLATTGFGYTIGGGRVRAPKARYYLGANSFDIYSAMHLEGDGVGGGTGGSSVMRWAAGATGLRIQRYNTSGDAGASNGHANDQTLGGDGTIISGLFLQGGYTTTEGEYPGVLMRAAGVFRDGYIEKFQGDAIRIVASAGGNPEGQASCFGVGNSWVQLCRNGLYVDGPDANVGLVTGFSAVFNRQWGVWDSGFLGSCYIGCHTSGNGMAGDGTAGSPASAVSHSGNRYFVKIGQEAGASTNAPSGAATDNTWWYYWLAGGVTTGVPVWTNGITIRAGGSYGTDDASACHVLLGCYAEGNQPPAQLSAKTLVVGGLLASSNSKGGGIIRADGNAVWVNDFVSAAGVVAQGATHSFGRQDAISADPTINLDTTNSFSMIQARRWAAGAPTTLGSIQFSNASGVIIAATNAGHSIYNLVGSTYVAVISGTGVAVDGLVSATGSIKSSHATAGVGYATGAGGAVTQLTSRTTGVTLNKACGAITLVSAPGTATWQSFTVTNSAVAATDVVRVVQKSGADLNMIHVTAVASGSFQISFATTGGTTTDQPVFNFAIVKAVAA